MLNKVNCDSEQTDIWFELQVFLNIGKFEKGDLTLCDKLIYMFQLIILTLMQMTYWAIVRGQESYK